MSKEYWRRDKPSFFNLLALDRGTVKDIPEPLMATTAVRRGTCALSTLHLALTRPTSTSTTSVSMQEDPEFQTWAKQAPEFGDKVGHNVVSSFRASMTFGGDWEWDRSKNKS